MQLCHPRVEKICVKTKQNKQTEPQCCALKFLFPPYTLCHRISEADHNGMLPKLTDDQHIAGAFSGPAGCRGGLELPALNCTLASAKWWLPSLGISKNELGVGKMEVSDYQRANFQCLQQACRAWPFPRFLFLHLATNAISLELERAPVQCCFVCFCPLAVPPLHAEYSRPRRTGWVTTSASELQAINPWTVALDGDPGRDRTIRNKMEPIPSWIRYKYARWCFDPDQLLSFISQLVAIN